MITRRRLIGGGGASLAVLAAGLPAASEGETVDIVMQGRADGSHVWFDPVGVHIRPGQTVRWTNRDPGNSHTATAYHPKLSDRPRRIPPGVAPWDSDYLLPGESFSVTLTREGVYDFYCVPHEHAGMVGRIVVGDGGSLWKAYAVGKGEAALPEAALKNFPAVKTIVRDGVVHMG